MKNILLIFFLSIAIKSRSQSDIVKMDSFYSVSVNLTLKYHTILPSNYSNGSKRYPVIYLLHGHTGNYTSWLTYAKLPKDLATRYQCIIITPDAGNSFYVNWTGQTDNKPHRWADMITKDLMSVIERKYRVIPKRSARAIGGLSMGGFGALSIGLSNPELFGFIFSSAGAIDFCKYVKDEFARDTLDWNSPTLWSQDKKNVGSKNFTSWKERTPSGLVFKNPHDADLSDPYFLLAKLDSSNIPFIHVDCGNEDFHLHPAINFNNQLRSKTNGHSLLILPGNHEVPYWEQAIEHTLMVMKQQGFFPSKPYQK